MGAGYGLVRGLVADVTGAQAGQADRRELERQARMDALKERLLNAQINTAQQGKYTIHSDATGTYRLNSITGQWERIGEARPKAPVLGSPEYLKAQTDLARAKAGITRGAKQHVPLTDSEKRAARQVVRGLREMREHYRVEPSAAETSVGTAALEGAGNIPLVGGLVRGVTGPLAQKSRSAHQQGFQRAATTVRHHYGMIAPHARITLGLLHDINTAIVPPAGTDSATIANTFAPEWDYTIDQINEQLGPDAEPETPKPKITAAPRTQATQSPRHNPKFWHP